MNQHTPSTPQNSHHFRKQLQATATSIRALDCPYCKMKRKFNIGSSSDQKCMEHTMAVVLGSENEQFASSKCENFEHMTTDQMIDALEDVESSLEYYWDNLREISGGDARILNTKLEPVLESIKRVQQKIGMFFYSNGFEHQYIRPICNQNLLPKYRTSGSQRHIKTELSSLYDQEENTAAESIKQWVMHFHKILQMRHLSQSQDLLPCEQDLEMKIFKQSLESKFLTFSQQISQYENKVRDVLTKLIYYMEKSSEAVPEKQIEQDILFIEGQNLLIESRESELERLLLMQASSVQSLLQGTHCN